MKKTIEAHDHEVLVEMNDMMTVAKGAVDDLVGEVGAAEEHPELVIAYINAVSLIDIALSLKKLLLK